MLTISYVANRSLVGKKHFFEVIEAGEPHEELVLSGPVEEVEQSVLVDVFRRHRGKTRMVNFPDFARWATHSALFETCQEILFNFLKCCSKDRVPQKLFHLYLGYGSYQFAPFNNISPVVHKLKKFGDLMYLYLSVDELPPRILKDRQILHLGNIVHGLQLNLHDTDEIPVEWMTDNIRTLLIRSSYPRNHFTALLRHIQEGRLEELRLIQIIRGPKMCRSDVDALASRLRELLDSFPGRNTPIAIQLDYDGVSASSNSN